MRRPRPSRARAALHVAVATSMLTACAGLVGLETLRASPVEDAVEAGTDDAPVDVDAPNDSVSEAEAEAAPTFVKVGTYAPAQAQPTAVGHVLAALQPFHGALYIGYGDYSNNTGPITVGAYDPKTGTFREEFVADTEAIYTMRVFGDQLYIPHIDPRPPADGGAQYDYTFGPPWQQGRVGGGGGQLLFDMATDGTRLFIVGEDYTVGATVWRSTDAGWENSLAVPSRFLFRDGGAIAVDAGVLGEDDARFYFIGTLGAGVVVQAFDYTGGAHPHSLRHEGGGWGDFNDVLGDVNTEGSAPLVFNGEFVFAQHARVAPGNLGRGALRAFGAVAPRTVAPWTVRGYATSSNALYAVADDGNVYVTASLLPSTPTWTLVAAGPPAAYSLAVMDGVLYVGDANAGLWKLSAPVP